MLANDLLKKCKKCVHYYARMIGANGKGYNPNPSCYRLEDIGERPNLLKQDCFKKKGH